MRGEIAEERDTRGKRWRKRGNRRGEIRKKKLTDRGETREEKRNELGKTRLHRRQAKRELGVERAEEGNMRE